jgi:hypothetical protein
MKSILTIILSIFLIGSLTLKSQCVIIALGTDVMSCNGNGTIVDIYVEAFGESLGSQGIIVEYNGNNYPLPSNGGILSNININTPSFTLTACSTEFPTCCLTKTFDNACRIDCEISSVFTNLICGENGGFINTLLINPEGNDLGDDGFTVTINGNTYSSNSGGEIILNNLFIPALTFTYTVCSNESPGCCYTETISNTCFVPCDLSGVEIDQVCSNDTLTSLTFTPSGINMGIDGFTIEINGLTYTTSGASLELNNQEITDQFIEYTLCCNEYPTYCHTLNFENECYGYIPPCNITQVITSTACTSAAHYKLTMTPSGINLGNQGFHGMVNGVAFNKNMSTIVLDSLPTLPNIIYTICSNAAPNCCFTDTLVNPCYTPPCHLLHASTVITCDSNSLYTIAITPSGSNIGQHGFFGQVNNIGFNQDSTTIVLDSLAADSLILYHICSNATPTCCFNDTLVNPCYTSVQPCNITGAMTDVHCLSNGMTNISITPQGLHLGSHGFHGVVNTIAFNQDSSTISVDSLTTDSLLVYTICSNVASNCCFTDTLVIHVIHLPINAVSAV